MAALSFGDRAEAMRQRVARTAARSAFFSVEDQARIDAALRAALQPRIDALDLEHPDLLHPARTALIMIEDLGVADADVVIAGILCETIHTGLTAHASAVAAAGAHAIALLKEVPGASIGALLQDLPDATGAAPVDPRSGAASAAADTDPADADPSDRLERLVVASHGAQVVALTERLDHARHLHLRPRDEWEDYHAATCAAYAPVAGRTHPRLGERLDGWCSIFRRRFLAV